MDKSALNVTRTWFDVNLREALERAQSLGHMIWFAKSVPIPPIPMEEAFARYDGFGWMFAMPNQEVLLGLGITRDWQWTSSEGLNRMETIIERLRANGLPPHIMVTGGQAFSPEASWPDLPGVYLALPTAQVVQTATGTTLTVVLQIIPDTPIPFYHQLLAPIWQSVFASPPADPFTPLDRPQRIQSVPLAAQWVKMVEDAIQDIHQGQFEKVVLARCLELGYAKSLPIAPIIENLRAGNPEATVFAMRYHDVTFVGATPELLAEVTGTSVRTMCLAGSTPRGVTPEDDFRLAETMKHDKKTQDEHATVKQHIREALSQMCRSVDMPLEPTLKKLPSVQHLYTPVSAQLASDATIWSVVGALQPTPAVAGYPVVSASAYIMKNEPFLRGWYAGSVGWANLSGDGQWMVSLRSGVIRQQEVRLYAGCGIMGDSDPVQELRESEWKFNTMLTAIELEGESL